MAAVSVFVDDAIRGRLPLVCAKTGEPADLTVRTQQQIGGGGGGLRSWAWVLVFFGPPGWLALLVVLMVAPAGEYLTVRVPQSTAAYQREKLLKRFRLAAFLLGVANAVVGLLGPGQLRLTWLALACTFFVAGAVLHSILYFQAIGVSLDASRRWVTLNGVHPAFVRAVEAQERPATPAAR